MRHKFRFSEKCIERLKEYCGIADKRGWGGKKASSKKKKKEKSVQVEAPEKQEAAIVEIPEIDGIIARTDKGCVRPSNQDAVIVAPGLAGIADGMGGHRGGETASSMARDRLIEILASKTPGEAALKLAVAAVNFSLFAYQAENEALSGMGTTLTALWAAEDKLFIAHVGDSRAYRLRDGELTQITCDHSMVEELVRQGMITPEQAACHPMRNVITRAVGTEPFVEVDIIVEERHPGDLWLLCSDGLHGMVSDARMQAILADNSPEKAADLMLQEAKDAGGRDNISLVIFLDREDGQ